MAVLAAAKGRRAGGRSSDGTRASLPTVVSRCPRDRSLCSSGLETKANCQRCEAGGGSCSVVQLSLLSGEHRGARDRLLSMTVDSRPERRQGQHDQIRRLGRPLISGSLLCLALEFLSKFLQRLQTPSLVQHAVAVRANQCEVGERYGRLLG